MVTSVPIAPPAPAAADRSDERRPDASGPGAEAGIDAVRLADRGLGCAAVEWGDPVDLPLGDATVAMVLFHVPLFSDAGRHHQLSVGEYLAWVVEVIDEAERVLEVGGRLVLVAMAQESRQPLVDVASFVVEALREAGMTPPVSYTWCSSTVAVTPVHGLPIGFDMTAAELVAPASSWRVLVAGKGQDHRAGSILERERLGLPHRSTIPAELWDTAHHGVWVIPASLWLAQGDLPVPLIEVILSLFTFVDDQVVSPLAGTANVAAVAGRMGRRVRCFEPDHQVLDRILRSLGQPGEG